MYQEKLVPQAVEAERAVLGSLLIDGKALLDVFSWLQPEHFHQESNGWIYRAMLSLFQAGKPIDQLTVAHELQKDSKLVQAGGAAYLSRLVGETPTSIHAGYYGNLVKDAAVSRQLISVAGQIASLGYNEADTGKAYSQAYELVRAIGEGVDSKGGLVSMGKIADDAIGDFMAWMDKPGLTTGIETGFVDLDRAIGGLEPGLLYLLAGRPSMGKTQLVLSIVSNLVRRGEKVAFFSLDSSKEKLLQRLVLSEAGFDIQALREQGRITEEQKAKLMEAYHTVSRLAGFHTDDQSSLTIKAVRARAERWRQQLLKAPCLLVFDYVELASDWAEGREQKISQVILDLRNLGRSMQMAVIAVCQLNREVEKQWPPVPQLMNLRWSGMQEQAADVVMLLYREEYYKARFKEKGLEMGKDKMNCLDVIIAKQKDGPTGRLKLFYDESTGRIGNWKKQDA